MIAPAYRPPWWRRGRPRFWAALAFAVGVGAHSVYRTAVWETRLARHEAQEHALTWIVGR